MDNFWQDLSKAWAEIVAKSWSDEAFRKQVVANPAAVLKQHGFDAAGRVEIQVRENSNSGVITLPLPPKPQGLSEDSLRVHASKGTSFCSTCST